MLYISLLQQSQTMRAFCGWQDRRITQKDQSNQATS